MQFFFFNGLNSIEKQNKLGYIGIQRIILPNMSNMNIITAGFPINQPDFMVKVVIEGFGWWFGTLLMFPYTGNNHSN